MIKKLEIKKVTYIGWRKPIEVIIRSPNLDYYSIFIIRLKNFDLDKRVLLFFSLFQTYTRYDNSKLYYAAQGIIYSW